MKSVARNLSANILNAQSILKFASKLWIPLDAKALLHISKFFIRFEGCVEVIKSIRL
jgi:hypothetical protein